MWRLGFHGRGRIWDVQESEAGETERERNHVRQHTQRRRPGTILDEGLSIHLSSLWPLLTPEESCRSAPVLGHASSTSSFSKCFHAATTTKLPQRLSLSGRDRDGQYIMGLSFFSCIFEQRVLTYFTAATAFLHPRWLTAEICLYPYVSRPLRMFAACLDHSSNVFVHNQFAKANTFKRGHNRCLDYVQR